MDITTQPTTDVVVLVAIPGGSVALADIGTSARFFDDAGAELAAELDEVTAAEALFWVRVPSVGPLAVVTAYYDEAVTSTRAPPWDGYEGVWHLRQNPAGTFDDASGNGHSGDDGLVASPQVDGIVGAAQAFDGSGERIVVADAAALDVRTYTLSVWFNRAAELAQQFELVFDKVQGGTPGAGYGIHMGPTGQFVFSHRAADANGPLAVTGGATDFLDGGWHQLVAVVDEPTLTWAFYADGELIEAGTFVAELLFTRADMTFGGAENGGDGFAGALDEIRLERRASDEARIDVERLAALRALFTVGQEESLN